MQKMKNRKRLVTLVLTFLLTFVVGAAFALADGVLTFTGNIHVAAPQDLYVSWTDVQPPPSGNFIVNPSLITSYFYHTDDGTYQFTQLLDGADARTDQTIIWDVYFALPGTEIAMSARAINRAFVDAYIERVNLLWDGAPLVETSPGIFELTALGLTVMFEYDSILGVLEAGETTLGALVLVAEWNGVVLDEDFTGNIPHPENIGYGEAGYPGNSNPLYDDEIWFGLAGVLEITFSYTQAP